MDSQKVGSSDSVQSNKLSQKNSEQFSTMNEMAANIKQKNLTSALKNLEHIKAMKGLDHIKIDKQKKNNLSKILN